MLISPVHSGLIVFFSMKNNGKNIIVVGDRILIRPDTGEKKSPSGLYLPPSVVEKQDVRGGVVVEVGPGIPLGSPDSTFDEPWKEKKKYLIVSQSAILVLIRDDIEQVLA